MSLCVVDRFVCRSERKKSLKCSTNILKFTTEDLFRYRQFNMQQFYVLPTQCIYVFCVDLRINSDYFPIQH